MTKVFNTAGVCVPQLHYMANIEKRVEEIKKLVDDGKYFTINRARQYGKTTTLLALREVLKRDYYVVSMDFQTFDQELFEDGKVFAKAFTESFLREFRKNRPQLNAQALQTMQRMEECADGNHGLYTLKALFEQLSDLCSELDKSIVLMIDEVDSAANNQVFLDFLAQIRAQYLRRFQDSTFQSVILAGVYDIKNLKLKFRPEQEHMYNSPWNIAADFKIDMSLSVEDICGMLAEYETDHQTGMQIQKMAEQIFDYTSGYPFLVSRICQIMDEDVSQKEAFVSLQKVWTQEGFLAAVRILLAEKNPLFESLIGKLHEYPELNEVLQTLLFTGRTYAYATDEPTVNLATMFGFVKNKGGNMEIANRIFETRLYNYYLSENEMQKSGIYKASLQDKSQFIINGHLNMKKILERFVVHFQEIFGDRDEKFLEEEGRRYFLLYLRPIINGTGNYYIEARTRDMRRTDVIVDYHGEQFIIEMKIWHGAEYHSRGEKQLIQYLDDYHVNQGYMLSFNFNKKKTCGVHEVICGDKTIIEAVV